MRTYTFDAVILDAGGGGAIVEFPYDVMEEFGTKGQVKIRATFAGQPYRGSLVRMGGERHVVGVLKAIRKAIGKDIGDTIRVTLTRDMEERVVEVPEELRVALAGSPAAAAAYEKLSYTHRREHAGYVAEAKKSETKLIRAERTVEWLLAGKNH